MSAEIFNSADPLSELRAICAELEFPVEERDGGLFSRVEADDQVGGALDVRLVVVERPRLIRLTTLAPGASLKRECLSDALLFCNIWNANRSIPRASVANVEERARDLAFILDCNLKIDLPVERDYVKNHMLARFLNGSAEFFDAALKTFAAEFTE